MNIHEDEVGLLAPRVLDFLRTFVSFQGLVTEGSEEIDHELEVRGIVFDYEYAGRRTSSATGREMVKRLPFPYSLSNETRPPMMAGEFLADVQTQTGAFVRACGGAIHLSECLEQL